MISKTVEPKRLILLRMNPGDDVLQCLRAAVAQHGIQNAVIMNGAGSLSAYHVHVVKTTNLPPGDVYFKGECPCDIISLSGFVMGGRVHAHITFSDTQKAMGGHLEEGTRVLTFCGVAIADTPTADLTNWDALAPL